MDAPEILPIIQVGAPVLRACARPLSIEEIRTVEIQDLIEQMRETMRAAPGVGLAAPQIDKPIQLAVIEDSADLQSRLSKEALSERERVPIPFHVIINPKLSIEDERLVEFYEGCLSLNGFVAMVSRFRSVRVNALNERGDEVEYRASGWYARILQHEIDHLNGTVYIDRMITQTFTTVANKELYWELSAAQVRAKLGLESDV
jgi:peptide deformylase